MGDRTEDEDERYVRKVARRMPVLPEQFADCLRKHSFALLYANRDEGINEISLLRPSPTLAGLFDRVWARSNIRGEGASVNIGVTIAPGSAGQTGLCRYVPATKYGYAREDAEFRGTRDSLRFSERVAAAVPTIFADLYEPEARRFYDDSASARAAAERYLCFIAASVDLQETLERLKKRATDAQWKRSQRHLQGEMLASFGLESNWRVIWDIAA